MASKPLWLASTVFVKLMKKQLFYSLLFIAFGFYLKIEDILWIYTESWRFLPILGSSVHKKCSSSQLIFYYTLVCFNPWYKMFAMILGEIAIYGVGHSAHGMIAITLLFAALRGSTGHFWMLEWQQKCIESSCTICLPSNLDPQVFLPIHITLMNEIKNQDHQSTFHWILRSQHDLFDLESCNNDEIYSASISHLQIHPALNCIFGSFLEIGETLPIFCLNDIILRCHSICCI